MTSECYVIEYSDPRWLDFISSKPKANIFHHPVWIEAIASSYGYRPFILVISDRSGQITSGIPLMEIKSFLTGKRWVSLPFSDYCNPLFGSDEDMIKMLHWMENERQNLPIRQIEIRWGLKHQADLLQDNQFYRQTVSLDPNPEIVAQRFERVHKQNIRSAMNRGVRLEWGKSTNFIQIFYNLQVETRMRQGVPVQPYLFFKNLVSLVVDHEMASVLLAYIDDECIAGLVLLHWGESVIAKYAASREKYWSLRPNNLLFWEGIRWACDNGYSYFDLGRTEAENRGLRRYKKGWGAQEESLPYSIFGKKTSFSSNSVIRKSMGYILKHSPAFICKVSGNLLYKHFG